MSSSEIVTIVATTIWPAVGLVLLIVYRKPAGALLGRLREADVVTPKGTTRLRFDPSTLAHEGRALIDGEAQSVIEVAITADGEVRDSNGYLVKHAVELNDMGVATESFSVIKTEDPAVVVERRRQIEAVIQEAVNWAWDQARIAGGGESPHAVVVWNEDNEPHIVRASSDEEAASLTMSAGGGLSFSGSLATEVHRGRAGRSFGPPAPEPVE
jgi:hypothetical protein